MGWTQGWLTLLGLAQYVEAFQRVSLRRHAKYLNQGLLCKLMAVALLTRNSVRYGADAYVSHRKLSSASQLNHCQGFNTVTVVPVY